MDDDGRVAMAMKVQYMDEKLTGLTKKKKTEIPTLSSGDPLPLPAPIFLHVHILMLQLDLLKMPAAASRAPCAPTGCS